jgi:hypothetical protein
MGTGGKATVYWWLLTSANTRRCGGPSLQVRRVEFTILTSLHPLAGMKGILCVSKSNTEIVNLPLSSE